MVNGIAALDQVEGMNPEAPGDGGMPGGMPVQGRRNIDEVDIINMLMAVDHPPRERQEEENVGGDGDNGVGNQEGNGEEDEEEEEEEDVAVCGFSFFLIISKFTDIYCFDLSQPTPSLIGNIFGRLFGRARVEESSSSESEDEDEDGDDEDDEDRNRGDLNAVD